MSYILLINAHPSRIFSTSNQGHTYLSDWLNRIYGATMTPSTTMERTGTGWISCQDWCEFLSVKPAVRMKTRVCLGFKFKLFPRDCIKSVVPQYLMRWSDTFGWIALLFAPGSELLYCGRCMADCLLDSEFGYVLVMKILLHDVSGYAS